MNYENVKGSYTKLWSGMVVLKTAAARQVASRILAGKERYQAIELATGVPWYFTGLVHYREGNNNFGTYLGNGQSLSRRTTIVPRGRGPFNTFTDGAVDAYRLMGYTKATDWSFDHLIYLIEGYNGYGYWSHGIPSPYLWGGTSVQKRGKYVADGVYSSSVMDTQLGVLAVLRVLMDIDGSIVLHGAGEAGKTTDAIKPVPATPVAPKVKEPTDRAPEVIGTGVILTGALIWFKAHLLLVTGGILVLAVLAYLAYRHYAGQQTGKAIAVDTDHPAAPAA